MPPPWFLMMPGVEDGSDACGAGVKVPHIGELGALRDALY
jgi:hypothetical protein